MPGGLRVRDPEGCVCVDGCLGRGKMNRRVADSGGGINCECRITKPSVTVGCGALGKFHLPGPHFTPIFEMRW